MLKLIALALAGALVCAVPAQAMVNCEVYNWRGEWLAGGYWPTEERARKVLKIILSHEWFYRIRCSPED